MSYSLHSGCHPGVLWLVTLKPRRRRNIRAAGALRFLPMGKRRFVAERDKMSLLLREVYRPRERLPGRHGRAGGGKEFQEFLFAFRRLRRAGVDQARGEQIVFPAKLRFRIDDAAGSGGPV